MSARDLLHKATEAGWPMVAEATLELVRARVMTMLPARIYLRGANAMSNQFESCEVPAHDAARIGRLVEAVARRAPFRAACLQRAIAVQRMLRRRNLPARLVLGVSVERHDRADPRRGRAAHAWVSLGGEIVCGNVELDRFAIVARFPGP
jgi:hypothetical protein